MNGDCRCLEVCVYPLDPYSYACVGGTLTFLEVCLPEKCCDEVEWSGGDGPNSDGCWFSTHWDTTGVKTVTAATPCASDSMQVTILGIGKVVKDGTDDEGPLYVCLNGTVGLEIKSDPPGVPWLWCPTYWSILIKPSGSNPSISSPGDYHEKATLLGLDKPGTYIVRARTICNGHWTWDTITITVPVCNSDNCEWCVDGECVSLCDPDNCETCVDGECKVCGGNPNQKCCNGSCCDKVWTTETHTAINESCPSVADCYEPGVGCDGTKVTVSQSYESCLNVGVGLGEHCECNEEEQVVGYNYTCQEDWDWSMMVSCAFEAALCAIQCVGAYADPASCSDCLGTLELDCCGGDTCHICDFLESCEPTNAKEIKDNVFTDFGGC